MNYIRHLNGFFARLAEDKRMSSYHISLYFALFQQWNADRFGEQFVITRTETMYMSRLGSVNTYARCMKELSQWGYITYIPSSNIHSGSRVSCIRFDTASDTASNTATDTARNAGIENDTAGDTGTDTTSDTGTSSNLINDTTTDTGTDTGIENDTARNTGTNTASDTGISSDLKSDTGRNTASDKNEGAGIKNDTASDTATDTPFINIINKNKQEEESVRRNQKFDVDENEKKRKRFRTTNSENLPDEKSQVPDLSETEQFFEQNQFPRSEAQKFYAHYQSSGWKTGDQMKILSWQAVARKWMNNTQSFKTDERQPNQVGTSKLSVTVNKNYSEPL